MSEYTTVETHILNDLQAAAENLLNKYNALRAENDQLKSSAVCTYCGKVSHTKEGQSKLDMMIDHMAECEKHPVAGLLITIEQLRSSKRELVEALENLYHHVKNGQEHQCCIYCANVKAAIAKHREE
jgi:hemerythrin-like domain-containing protein